jgi:LmbE family N-acetylglucosaminyl deacetylase
MDDESINTGALIAKRTRHGEQVRVLVLHGRAYDYGRVSTDKSKNTMNQEYVDFATACTTLGVSANDLIVCNLQEGEPGKVGYYRILEVIERELAEFKPDEVIIPAADDLNQDHRHDHHCCQIALRTCNRKGIQRIMAALAPEGELRQPTHIEVVSSDDVTKKCDAIMAYRNERRDAPHVRSRETIKSMAVVVGAQAGEHYGEGYQIYYQRG